MLYLSRRKKTKGTPDCKPGIPLLHTGLQHVGNATGADRCAVSVMLEHNTVLVQLCSNRNITAVVHLDHLDTVGADQEETSRRTISTFNNLDTVDAVLVILGEDFLGCRVPLAIALQAAKETVLHFFDVFDC